MKIGSNRNIYKVEFYHQKSTKSQSPATPPEATTEILLLKSLDNSVKDVVTISSVGKQKKCSLENKMMKTSYNIAIASYCCNWVDCLLFW